MTHLERLGNRVRIPIEPDEDGFTGRECPDPECEGYFKVQFGTGLKGDVPCHCPYCGHTAGHGQFGTKEQIEYAKSVFMREVSDAVYQDLKGMEFNHPARGPFGIGLSMKVERGSTPPIRYYKEKRLETEVICDRCTLRYTIYGVFAYCPDCGTHNSRQILSKNLDLAEKEVALASGVGADIAEHLISDAMENVVSAFDGFGRETCRVRSESVRNPKEAENVSFQNLDSAKRRVQALFGLDFSTAVDEAEWAFACRCFQKRHLLAHKMGVVDQAYLDVTGDRSAAQGRKVAISADEVTRLMALAKRLGEYLVTHLPQPMLSSSGEIAEGRR